MTKKADNKEKQKKEKKPFNKKLWLKRLLIRLPIFLIIIYFLVVIALKMIVRHPEPLRAGLEDYISQVSNTRASINTLEHVMFHPKVDIRMRDLTFHSHENAADIKMSAEYVEVVSPFWSVITPVKRLKNLIIQNGEISAGYIFAHKVILDKLNVVNKDGPEQYGAFIEATGTYAGKNMLLEAALVQDGEYYYLAESVPFSMSIDNVEVNAQLIRKYTGQRLENVILKIGDKVSSPQNYDLYVDGNYNKETPVQCVLDHIDDMKKCDQYFEVSKKEEVIQ